MLDNLPFFVRNVHYGRVKRVSASVSIPARVPGKMDRRFIIGVVLIIASVLAFSVLGGFLRGRNPRLLGDDQHRTRGGHHGR